MYITTKHHSPEVPTPHRGYVQEIKYDFMQFGILSIINIVQNNGMQILSD